MRIGFDARMAAHSGIGTYVRQLLAALAAEPGPHRYVVFTAPDLVARLPQAPGFEYRPATTPIYSSREHLSWQRELLAARCDLYHVPHYNVPLGFPAPFVVTVHDLIHVLFPGAMRRRWHAPIAGLLLRHAVRRARRVIAVSECTRLDLVRRLGVATQRVVVIPNGVAASFRPYPPPDIEAFRVRCDLPAAFLLYVGLRRPHKNLVRLVQAFAAAGLDPGLHLVLWGRPGEADAAVAAAVRAHGLEARVHCIDRRLGDAEMPLLYNAAHALVLPSLYEGFGLPALEAMACGVPVLAADAGALPEVVGEAALRADPADVAAWAAGLERISSDAALRTVLRARGPERAAQFDWREVGRRTRAIYEAASAGRG